MLKKKMCCCLWITFSDLCKQVLKFHHFWSVSLQQLATNQPLHQKWEHFKSALPTPSTVPSLQCKQSMFRQMTSLTQHPQQPSCTLMPTPYFHENWSNLDFTLQSIHSH